METNVFSGSYTSECSSRAVASHPHTFEWTVKDVSPPRTSQSALHSLAVHLKLHVERPCAPRSSFSWEGAGPMCLASLRKSEKGHCWWREGSWVKVEPDARRASSAMGSREGKGWPINKDISRNGKWVCIIYDCKICLNVERKVATFWRWTGARITDTLSKHCWMWLWLWKTQNTP